MLQNIFTATGEPPLCMSVSVFFAIRCAIDAARGDAGNLEWQSMGNCLYCKHQYYTNNFNIFFSHPKK